jgi:hypothetical protein
MDECIQINRCSENDSILEEEGPLDEPNFLEHERTHRRTDSAAWSSLADAGSPMDIDGRWATGH